MNHLLFKLIINNMINSMTLLTLTQNIKIIENIMIIKNNEFTFIITKTNKKVNLFMRNNNISSSMQMSFSIDSVYRIAYNIVDSILLFVR